MLHFHDIGRSDGQDNGTQGSSEEALLPPGAPFLFAFLLQSDVDGDANFFPRLDFGSTENNAERRTEEDLTNAHLTAGDHRRVTERAGRGREDARGVQSREKVLVRGCVKFLPALA